MDISDPDSPARIALVLFLYLLPAILVIITNLFDDRDRYWKMRSIKAAIYINVLLGWTVIGWFWALRFVWFRPKGQNPLTPAGAAGPEASSPPQSNTWPINESTDANRRPCSTCSGSKKVKCGFCFGHGGRWQQPQTESGTGQWVPCTYCGQTGYIECNSCNGKGWC